MTRMLFVDFACCRALHIEYNEIFIRIQKSKKPVRDGLSEFGWGTRIRTWECRNQNPVPYRLAIPQKIVAAKDGGYDGIRTCDPNIMSVVL